MNQKKPLIIVHGEGSNTDKKSKLEVTMKTAQQDIPKSVPPLLFRLSKDISITKQNMVQEILQEIDKESQMGRFGWPVADNDMYSGIPYLLRGTEKYFNIRMMKTKRPISNYLDCLHQDIYSHYFKLTERVTPAEVRLLNEINRNHCDNKFGRELFDSESSLLKYNDAYALHEFLDTCHRKLSMNSQIISNKIGFIQIGYTVVPFVSIGCERYMPLHCFSNTNNLEIEFITGWDLAYMKFCCLYQGTWKSSSDIMAVVSLTNLKAHLPSDTYYEICWPHSDNHELIKSPPKIHFVQPVRANGLAFRTETIERKRRLAATTIVSNGGTTIRIIPNGPPVKKIRRD